MNIEEFFYLHKSVVVAVSGGVDSAVLLTLAKKYADKVYACFVKSVFQPEFEEKDAFEICETAGVELHIIQADVLSDENVVSNPTDRCYYCKKLIFSDILDFAKKVGAEVVEGTNASDDISDRPGFRVLGELGVFSPLKICGYDKALIRKIAAEYGLSVADKPSYACLATRVPVGVNITKEILQKTEKAEMELMKLGFSDFRIRYLNGDAKLQFTQRDMKKLMDNREAVVNVLKPYYSNILLDLKERD